MIRIAVLGSGYVGLVTGACLADFGHRVTCADVDAAKIAKLKRGDLPFYEPGLRDLLDRNHDGRRLSFTDDLERAVQNAQVVFICVGTPPAKDGSADLSAVFDAGRLVARTAGDAYKLVVQKSTAPVGTARRLRDEIRKAAPKANVEVASNPEFLREGSAIETFMRPDRVVVGVESEAGEKLLRQIYRPLYLIETPMVVTNLETAELIKYAANAFLATKISFINEMANLSEAVGADVQMVAKGIGLDGRIGRKFLHAGPGYGGSCFPKDTIALVRFAEEAGVPMRIVAATVDTNRAQQQRMVDKIEAALGKLKGKRIALLGLSFKPNTDDIRESPALAVADGLVRRGARVIAHDPVAMDNAAHSPQGAKLEFALDAYSAAEGADAVVLATEWNPYRHLDLKRIAGALRRPLLFDLRNVYEPEDAARAGLEYFGVGRPRPGAEPKAARATAKKAAKRGQRGGSKSAPKSKSGRKAAAKSSSRKSSSRKSSTRGGRARRRRAS